MSTDYFWSQIQRIFCFLQFRNIFQPPRLLVNVSKCKNVILLSCFSKLQGSKKCFFLCRSDLKKHPHWKLIFNFSCVSATTVALGVCVISVFVWGQCKATTAEQAWERKCLRLKSLWENEDKGHERVSWGGGECLTGGRWSVAIGCQPV